MKPFLYLYLYSSLTKKTSIKKRAATVWLLPYGHESSLRVSTRSILTHQKYSLVLELRHATPV